jgi:pimeloyl-ACP methyl ester carboxylesterase
MRVITFTGWGQKADALAPLVEGVTAQHIHYQNFEGYKELLPFLKGKECNVVIGWSLGGQIALRAVAEGILQPNLLVLLATPFEFLVSPNNPFGMDINSFNIFERDFYKNPLKTQRKFTLLMNKHDSKAACINKEALQDLPSPDNWLVWLRELKHFSAAELDLSNLPKTLIVHGIRDHVVNIEQAYLLQQYIKGSSVTVLEDASHMWHWHAPFMVSHLIRREYESLAEAEYV